MEPTVTLVAPDDIGVDFVPAPVADVAEVVIDDEVLLVGAGGFPLVLNPTGALIWQCLDGEVSIGELITEFTEELNLDADVVQHDVIDFVRSLGNAGLLTGVGIEFNPEDLADTQAVVPLEVGEELVSFTLADLDGNERSLTEWRGRRTLVVNWSPDCGYCTMIASHLGELYPHFVERRVDLLFVSSGDTESNRSILEDAGLDVPMLLKGDAPDPFAGFGTPLAYLLDEEGRVGASVGWGADQVLVLAQDIAGVTLENNPFEPPPEPESVPANDDNAPTAKYLPAPGGT